MLSLGGEIRFVENRYYRTVDVLKEPVEEGRNLNGHAGITNEMMVGRLAQAYALHHLHSVSALRSAAKFSQAAALFSLSSCIA